jgi:hypothetical protein
VELDFEPIPSDLDVAVAGRDRRRQDLELLGSSLKLLSAKRINIGLVAPLLRLAKVAPRSLLLQRAVLLPLGQ